MADFHYPPGVRYVLAKRGLIIADADAAKIPPERVFIELCNWHGLYGWGPTILAWIKEIGSEIKWQEGENG